MGDRFVFEDGHSSGIADESFVPIEDGVNTPADLPDGIPRIVAIEFLLLAGTAYLASCIYYLMAFGGSLPPRHYFFAATAIAGFETAAALAFQQFAAVPTQSKIRFMRRGLTAAAVGFSFFLSAIYFLQFGEYYSRGIFVIQFFSICVVVLYVRAVSHTWLSAAVASGQVRARRAIILGDAHSENLTRLLEDTGIRTVGRFPLLSLTFGQPSVLSKDQKAVRDMIAEIRRQNADDIVAILPTNQLHLATRLADLFSELPVSLHVVPTESDSAIALYQMSELGNITTIRLLQPPLTRFDRFMKRAFDIVVASIGLMIVTPLFVLVAIAIKLDSRGPVLFRQERHGYNNHPIRVLKFRTMRTTEDGRNFTQASRNDPRVTRIGRSLRQSNLDELPQLYNVLIGEMSIVGPRPHPIALNNSFEEKIPPLSRRHNVKPGITGWAQVNGFRGETDTIEKMQRRIDCDLYYIDNWTLALDIKIIMMTLFSKKSYENAV